MNTNDSEASKRQPPPEGQWTTGLYDCFDAPSNCFFTCFFPCITFGRIAEIADRGGISRRRAAILYYALGGVHCGGLFPATFRTKLRGLFSLPEEPCSDLLLSCCCGCFSLCQQYRELQNRGVDPSIGWEANVEKWKKEGLKPPIAEAGMNR
ncbi:hypothetical protein UlMin_040883 [Ulmus minor]